MSPQQFIAHYRITSKLGEGGMGAVYRGTDTKLNRDVAIKVLPDSFANDPDRLGRFTREAQVLAALNHPNIAQIYGVEDRALVMELVEGEEIKGPIPVDTAIAYAKQLAAALEAAHEKGIVHRDLKPANIKITPEGLLKVLDFGLAKAAEDSPAQSAASPTISPTLSLSMTQAGMILGTAAYMSPEQARGKAVDKRADIWAFGVVLYEMLTGAMLFRGETASDSMIAVATREPDWNALPAGTPEHVRKLLARCLEKDPRLRLRDIGEARIALDSPPQPDSQPVAPKAPTPLPWIIALAGAAALAAAAAWLLKPAPEAPLQQFEITPPEGVSMGPANFGQLAVAPDGGAVLFVARDADGKVQLWLRRFDAPAAVAIGGTEGAFDPAWSPDGKSITFRTGEKLLAMGLAGGPPHQVGEHGTVPLWGRDGTILGVMSGGKLGRYPAAGGSPVPATKPEPGEIGQIMASYFPDGIRFLFLSAGPNGSVMRVAHRDGSEGPPLDTGKRTGRLAVDGIGRLWLLATATADDQLQAIRFNAAREAPEGDWRPLVGPIPRGPSWSASENGVLAFRRIQQQPHRLNWLDRAGRQSLAAPEIAAPIGATARLSPDGRRAAFVREYAGDTGIWLLDTATRAQTRLSLGKLDLTPVWSPDGAKLYYQSLRGADNLVVERRADGSGGERILYSGPQPYYPECVSADGRDLLMTATAGAQGQLFFLPISGGQPATWDARKLIWNASLSPDGRWLAFQHAQDIYVTPASRGTPGTWPISSGGGAQPVWRGKEIFYIAPGGKMMAVPIDTNNGVRTGPPVALFDTALDGSQLARFRNYDVTPDGKRFLIREDVNSGRESPISVIVHWERLLP